MSNITYRIATHDDLAEIAKVHIECFPEYIIARLGEHLVANYYREFMNEDNLFVLAEMDGKLVGFCMGYLVPSKARDNFMSHNRTALVKRLLWLCLTFDSLAVKKVASFITSKFKRRTVSTPVKAEGDLLSICVKAECRGKNIAPSLVAEFENLLRNKGAKDYTLGVYKTNAGAIRFYEKCGMAIATETSDEYKFYKHL